MIVLLKLILAHLLGDFFLQPDSWVKSKEELKAKDSRLYFHALIHAVLVFAFLWDWKLAIIVGVTHLLIDIIKLYAQNPHKKRTWFFADQALHFLSLILIYSYLEKVSLDPMVWVTEKNLIYLTAILLLNFPGSVIIKVVISRWAPETEETEEESLQNAGKYIGILERLFVFLFIMTGHWEAVGFLIAAKSVFRFGDLKESKDRKLTEYILIGTLLSFGIAMSVGIATSYLLQQLT